MRIVIVSLVAVSALAFAQQASAEYVRTAPHRSGLFTQPYNGASGNDIPAVYLFGQSGLNGESARIDHAQFHLPPTQVASLVTVGGLAWEICNGRAFTGRCVVVEGQVSDVFGATGISQIRSVRPARSR